MSLGKAITCCSRHIGSRIKSSRFSRIGISRRYWLEVGRVRYPLKPVENEQSLDPGLGLLLKRGKRDATLVGARRVYFEPSRLDAGPPAKQLARLLHSVRGSSIKGELCLYANICHYLTPNKVPRNIL